MRINLEQRLENSQIRDITIQLISVAVALCLVGLLFIAIGVNPLAALQEIVATSTSRFGFGDTLAKAAPLILVSLGVAVAFKMKVFSIGAEGQLIAGAICTAATGILISGQPPFIAVPAALAAGALGGVLWAVVPTLLAVFFGVSILITTLMMNFVAYYLAALLIFGTNSFLSERISNFPQGRQIADEARMPYIGDESVTWSIVFAMIAAVLVWLLLNYTRFGFSINVLGDAPSAALYAGLNVRTMIASVIAVSALLGGFAGAIEVLGRTYALDPLAIALGLGYTGIVVAIVAGLNTLAIVVVAIFFSALINSGSSLQSLSGDKVPSDIVSVIIGLILLVVLVGKVFVGYRLRIKTGL